MKKMIILFACCFPVVSLGATGPWGLWNRAVFNHTFAVDKLLTNRPITYAFEGEFSPEEKELVRQAFLVWIQQPLQYIQESKREQEFQDIIPILQRGVNLIQEVSGPGQADLTLEWAELAEHIGGSVMPPNDKMLVNLIIRNNMEFFYRIVAHEVGHIFGLGDQYWNGMEQSSPIYHTDLNTTQGSIMRSLDDLQKFSCDDADGLINLMDLRISQQNGHFSKRARNGWKSLCPGSTQVYKQAQPTQYASPVTRERDRWEDFTDERTYFVRQEQRGKMKNHKVSVSLPDLLALFNIGEEDRVQRDQTGRIEAIVNKKFVRRFSYIPGENERPDYPKLNILLQTPDGTVLEVFSFLVQPDVQSISYLNENKVVDGLVIEAPGKGVHIEGEKEATYHLRRVFKRTADAETESGIFFVSGEVKVDTLEKSNVVYKFWLTERSNFYDFFVSACETNTRDQKPTVHFVVSQDRESWLSVGSRVNPLPEEKEVFAKAFAFLQDNQKWLASYYQNFYPVLFGQPSTEYIQEQLKQALRPGVNRNMVK